MNKEANSNNKSEKLASFKELKFNFFDSNFRANPYPTYSRLRSEDPVHRYLIGGDWIVTRYADVKAVLKSGCVNTDDKPKTIQERNQYLHNKEKNLNTLAFTTSRFLFYMNPPDHTRLRSLVSKAFSPVVVERMRPHIQQIVNELLDKVRHKENMDIVTDLASPLSVSVISRLLGIPKESQPQLHEWVKVLFRILDPLLSLEEYESMNKATENFHEYLSTLITERKKAPQEDLISNLIAAQEQNDRLSQKEILAICTLLFAAGEETTGNTIGNGILALLQHPNQIEQLKREPRKIESAVEEIIRYDSAVQMITRIATDNLEIGKKTIKAGEKIVLCLGAANRDPAQFTNPDEFDINRKPNQHVSFADGIHYCLGSTLARVETQIAINTLLHKFSHLNLASNKLEWQNSIVLRGLNSLPITFNLS